MDLEILEVKPFTRHLKPGLVFEVELDLAKSGSVRDILTTQISGRLEAGDGTILGQLVEWSEKEGPDKPSRGLYAGNSDESPPDTSFPFTLYSPIGERGIEYLEELRDEADKGDVLIDIVVEAQVVESRSVISSVRKVKFQNTEVEKPEVLKDNTQTGLLTFEYDKEIKPSHNELWVLSGDGGADFLGVGKQVASETQYRIPSRDWTDEFLPALGYGQHLIVDIPDPADYRNEAVSEGLRAAYEEIDRAKADLQKGEWQSVVSHMLGLYDTIKEEEYWELENAGYTSEAEESLGHLYNDFSDYLGKFRHRRARSGDLQDKTIQHREDAYFMYSMMAGLVQLLAKKHSVRRNP